jgi:hypothetical protein
MHTNKALNRLGKLRSRKQPPRQGMKAALYDPAKQGRQTGISHACSGLPEGHNAARAAR